MGVESWLLTRMRPSLAVAHDGMMSAEISALVETRHLQSAATPHIEATSLVNSAVVSSAECEMRHATWLGRGSKMMVCRKTVTAAASVDAISLGPCSQAVTRIIFP